MALTFKTVENDPEADRAGKNGTDRQRRDSDVRAAALSKP